MKQITKRPPILVLWLGLSTVLLFSCQKEIKEVTPQPISEEAIRIINEPVAAGYINPGDGGPETEQRLFPKRENARTDAAAAISVAGTTDYVDFDDEMALTIIPDNAKNTFTYAPFYIQQVGTAWVHVKENNTGNYKPQFKSDYKHYHLSYQNFNPCITNGQYGKPTSGGGCVSFNPVKEPRKLNTHDGTQWIKIYAYDYDHSSRIFDLLGLRVTVGPLQLWFRKSNGTWYHWGSMGVGTWDISAYSTSITEVLIAGSGSTSIGFDNVKVLVPYF